MSKEKKDLLDASLEEKIKASKRLIMDWYYQFDGKVYISFSGGKDSTVLLHIARSIFPEIVAIFADTGLEFPEIKQFVKTIPNHKVIRPKMSFKQVLEKYGQPVVSKEQSQYIMQYRNAKELHKSGAKYKNGKKRGSLKTMRTRWLGNSYGRGKISEKWKFLVKAPFKITDKCCDIFKKDPFKRYEKETGLKPMVGVMAGESAHRAKYYFNGECNAFNAKRPVSKPMMFWNEGDIYKYIRDFNVEISSIYSMGYKRTGCVFCQFGLDQNIQEEDRFTRLKITHPKLFDYCMDKLGLREVIKFWTGREY